MEIRRFCDDRGMLDQVFDQPTPFDIKRCYVVYPDKGVVRGLHGHLHEAKLFYLAKGRAKFIAQSIATGEIETTMLDARKPFPLFVPPGFYNGFVALTDDCIVVCFSSLSLEESKKDDIRKDPFSIGTEIWGVKAR